MIKKILLILGIALIVISYFLILISYLKTMKKKSAKTAQELSLEILNDETNINLIETKDSYFSKYNLKRKTVKLATNTYNSNNYFKLAIASLLSYFSISNHKYLNLLSKIFTNLRFISFSPLIVIMASIFSQNIGDSKLGLVLFLIIATYQYLLNTIYIEVLADKEIEQPIKKILNTFIVTSKIFFIATLLETARLIIIIFNLI